MSKPRIGVDIDGVVCDWHIVAANIIALKTNITMDEIYEELRQGISDELEKEFKLVAAMEGPYKIAPSYSDAKVLLNMLHQYSYPIFYVTHRSQEFAKTTETWLASSELPAWNEVYYTDGKSKVDYAKELELDFFVEDRMSMAEELVGVVPNVLLLTRAWNELRHTEKRILRCVNWFEVYNEVTTELGSEYKFS